MAMRVNGDCTDRQLVITFRKGVVSLIYSGTPRYWLGHVGNPRSARMSRVIFSPEWRLGHVGNLRSARMSRVIPLPEWRLGHVGTPQVSLHRETIGLNEYSLHLPGRGGVLEM